MSRSFDASQLVNIVGAASYTHAQATAATVWTVNHNLGRKPLVDVLVAGREVDALVAHVSDNQFTVTFNSPQSGQALAR